MSSPRQRSGPTQQQIYRRRRGLALIVLFGLMAGVISGVASLFSQPRVVAIPGSTETALASSDASKACAPGAVEVQAFVGTDARSTQLRFAAAEKPYLWFSLTNLGSVACTFNVGSKVQFFNIVSGPDAIWSSKDCDRAADQDLNIILQAGKTITGPAGVWERVRSSTVATGSGCGAGQPTVLAAGSSYRLTVTVNGVISSNSVQFVLD